MDSKLIARYLAGNCSQKEREEVKQLAEASPANRKLMKEYRHIWEASESEAEAYELMFNVEQDWKKLQQRIIPDTVGVTDTHKSKNNLISKQLHSRMAQIMRVAVVVIIAALIGIITYQNFYSPSVVETVEPTLREIVTQKGQLANLKLSDGTTVRLNADSKLMLPNVFESDKREVFLEGEAFFDVAENPEKPFLIHSGDALVKILGTSLGVRSYPEDTRVSVVVKEGRVSLSSRKESGISNEAILSPGQLGVLSLADRQITTQKVQDMELYLSWTEGYLKFKNTPMKEVAAQLERKYDIDVELTNDKIAHLRLTAVLKSRSIRNVLDVISASLGVDYVFNQQKVIFSEK